MSTATMLLLAATVVSAIACGATLDQTFKQLPARHHIGALAYLAYVRAADMSNGLIWYPILGVGTTLLCIAAVVAGLLDQPSPVRTTALILLAMGTVVFTAATSRAAPTLLTLRRGEIAEEVAGATLNKFARFNAVRAVGITLTLAAAAWALVAALS